MSSPTLDELHAAVGAIAARLGGDRAYAVSEQVWYHTAPNTGVHHTWTASIHRTNEEKAALSADSLDRILAYVSTGDLARLIPDLEIEVQLSTGLCCCEPETETRRAVVCTVHAAERARQGGAT
mgnify:CR=1 FL=1